MIESEKYIENNFHIIHKCIKLIFFVNMMSSHKDATFVSNDLLRQDKGYVRPSTRTAPWDRDFHSNHFLILRIYRA